jgi:hypothetical protein
MVHWWVLVHSGPILHDVLVGAASFHSGHFSAQVKNLGTSAKGLLSASFIRACVKQGVCHTVGLAIYLKSILRQKNNYGNSNISLCKKYTNLQENPLQETKILQDIITLYN